MGSMLLLNIGGATVLVGIWIVAVVHTYRSLAADEKRSTAPRERLAAAPKAIRGQVNPARSAIA